MVLGSARRTGFPVTALPLEIYLAAACEAVSSQGCEFGFGHLFAINAPVNSLLI